MCSSQLHVNLRAASEWLHAEPCLPGLASGDACPHMIFAPAAISTCDENVGGNMHAQKISKDQLEQLQCRVSTTWQTANCQAQKLSFVRQMRSLPR